MRESAGLRRSGRRGRGRGAASEQPPASPTPPPPPPPPSPVRGAYADLEGFSFAVYLQDGLGPRLHLPDKLARKMRGRMPQRMDLLMKGCTVPWSAAVIVDGAGHMTLDEQWREFAIAHGVLRGYLLVFKLHGNGTLSIRMFDEGLRHQRVCDGSDAPSDSDSSSAGDFSDADEDAARPDLLGKGPD